MANESFHRVEAGEASDSLGGAPGNSHYFTAAGKRNALIIESHSEEDASRDLYLIDLENGTPTRLTRDGLNRDPEWGPNDEYIYFSRREGTGESFLARRRVDRAGAIQSVLVDSFENRHPTVSPDGTLLVCDSERADTGRDLYGFRMETGESFVLSAAAEEQFGPAFSPAGRYVAYTSRGFSRSVIVAPIEGAGDIEVTSDGSNPAWSPDGGHLYFIRQRSDIYRIPVSTDPVFQATGPEELMFSAHGHVHFDLLEDESLIVSFPDKNEDETENEIRLVLNYDLEMERLSPRNQP